MIDPAAEAELWARVDKADKTMGFFDNMKNRPVRVKDWQVFTINGKIDKNATNLVFGGLYARKGIFYFDNFRLFIESSKGKYEEVPVANGNFETDSLKPWNYFKKNGGFTMTQVNESPYEGKIAAKIDGSKLIKANTYGDNDSTGKYAVVNGIKIYYEEYGAGEPLLLLHGNSESISLFRLQIPEFAKQYRVIAVDTRGQGKSGEDGKTYSYDLFAEDMIALLQHLKIEKANVLGWSDGGNTSLIMAMKYPDRIKKAVMMGANVFIDNSVVDKWVFKTLNKELKELKGDTLYSSVNRARLITMLLTEPRHTFEELKSIQCPVLVVAGEKDVIKEGHTRQIAQNIKNSTLVIAPKETHYYPSENAAGFNKTVLEFLGK